MSGLFLLDIATSSRLSFSVGEWSILRTFFESGSLIIHKILIYNCSDTFDLSGVPDKLTRYSVKVKQLLNSFIIGVLITRLVKPKI